MTSLQRGRLCVIGAAVCWSVVGAAVKLASPPLNGWHVSAGRSLFAFLFLCAVVQPWRGRRRLPSFKVLLLACVYAAMLVLFIMSNTLTFSANAIFLQDSALVWIILLAPLLLKEPFRVRDLGVFGLCAAGMLLLFKEQLFPAQSDLSLQLTRTPEQQLQGNLLALLSGVAYAIVLLSLRWGRAKPRPVPPGASSHELGTLSGPTDAEQMIVWGNLFCFVFCGLQMGPLPGAELTLPLLIVAFMGVVQLGLGYWLASKGLSHVPAVEGSLLTLIEPVLNPIWAFIFIHELPGVWALGGGALIIAGVGYQALTSSAAPDAVKAPAPLEEPVPVLAECSPSRSAACSKQEA